MDHEAEYNARAAIPEHPAIFADWAERSAAVRRRDRVDLDLAYGDGGRETLDLYRSQAPDAPLVVYVHGGYWQWNDKSGYGFLAPPLLREGVAVAMVNYPLCPATPLGTIAASLRKALAWLWHGAHQLRFDRERMIVVGHSAGAHLAACAMTTDWPRLDGPGDGPAPPADLVKGGLLISGLYDLRPLVHTSLNAALGLDEDSARAASPAFMEPRLQGPLEIAFGGLESREFIRQSRDFGAAWAARGVTVAEIDLPDRHHLSVLEDLATADGRLTGATLDLLAQLG